MIDAHHIKEFTYHIGWRSRTIRPGRHKSSQRGMGMEFRGHTTLLSYPDPRRIDLRQTIRDPLEQIHVRIFNQKSVTPVFVLCDMSGSMRYGSQQTKISIAGDIVQSVAQSATHNGDPVGFIGFDDMVREDWICTLSTKPHQMLELGEQLKDYIPPEAGSSALADTIRILPRERSLIFLVSDFHMPIADLENALILMLRHHIVPVVIWNSTEYKDLPEYGIASVADPETGARRTLFLRKEYRQRILKRFVDRRQEIEALFLRFDMQPFFVENHFDADLLSEYFYQYVAA
ncbi:MAG: VWA domain-containing protein [Betaproteobacteria bacterium]|nr:VWA domain-containing protein [Betaproteobacteria bacterium]